MKKIGVLIFLCLIIFAQIVHAEFGGAGTSEDFNLEKKVGEIETAKDNVEENIDKIKETKWDYLGPEIKSILLKNKFISFVDGLLQKFDFVFVVLFGENYAFSLTLFFVVILWFYFFFKLSEILTDYSTFSPVIATAIGLGLSIIMSQLKMFRKMVEFFGWFVLSPEAWWWRIIIFAMIVFVLVFLYKLSSQIGQSVKEHSKESKEEMEKAEEKASRGIIKSFADAIVKALK